ncbi:hypothetical protein [Streptomyces zaomyceticus]|uniref:hypothetical protein n=1 Tax=Streptomyces zaomyceticus TaxID=68286 RepID=UPI0037A7844F
MDTTRNELLSAQAQGDPSAGEELGIEWQGRIRRLLVAHPEEVEALRELVSELDPLAPVAPSVNQQATASGDSRIYQAGGNQAFMQR